MLFPNKKRSETLDYIQAMLAQLRSMAETEDCDVLAYMIEMAYIEAGDIARGVRPASLNLERQEPKRVSVAGGGAYEP